MSILTFNHTNSKRLNFHGTFMGMPCVKISEDFCVDYSGTPHVGFNYDYGLAGDYIVNDNGCLQIFTAEQVETGKI